MAEKPNTPTSSAAVVDATADHDRRLKTNEDKLAAMEKMHSELGTKIEEWKKEMLSKITTPNTHAESAAPSPGAAATTGTEGGMTLVQFLKDIDILA